jgi:hypothetical protein
MRSSPANRKALIDVAVAGPLAGLVIAVPALLFGLRSSSITAGSDDTLSHGFLHGATVGSSIMFTVLTKISLGDVARYGALVHLSPLAFAGWLGRNEGRKAAAACRVFERCDGRPATGGARRLARPGGDDRVPQPVPFLVKNRF